MLNITQIAALQDNYIYLLNNPETGETAVVDPAEATPVLDYLQQKHWTLKYILNTHQHWDHIGGNPQLQQQTGCQIVASKVDQSRIPRVDIAVQEGDTLFLGRQRLQVLDTPGHTLGHLSYYLPGSKALFCGDTLFGMGCGRLFEGSAEQMWHSLQKIMALPAETQIYCAHEYTEANSRFAYSIEPENSVLLQRVQQIKSLRQQNLSTVPFTLADELATNPFLRTHLPGIQEKLNLAGQTDITVFAALRKLKDHF